MAKTMLVEQDFEEGRGLLRALDDAGFPVNAAFWYYFDEAEEWRLVLSSPVVSKKGRLEAYKEVQSILAKIVPPITLRLSSITVVDPHDELVRTLRSFVRIPSGIGGFRITGSQINNTFVEDSYVYRMS